MSANTNLFCTKLTYSKAKCK